MEETSTLTPSQRPTATLDSSDHPDEHDHHQHNIIDDTTSTSTQTSSKGISDSNSSLMTCRKTGSLVDDDDDKNYDGPEEDAHHHVHDAPPSQQQQQPDASVVHPPDHNPETTITATTTTEEDSSTRPSPNTDEITASSELTSRPPQPSWTSTTTATAPLPVIQSSQQQQQQWLLLNRHVPLPKVPSHNWDHILSSGNKIKTLVAEAMGQVQHTILTMQQTNQSSMKRARDRDGLTDDTNIYDDIDDDDMESPSSKQPRVVNVADFTVELAREKTAQVLQLQRVRSTSSSTCMNSPFVFRNENIALHISHHAHKFSFFSFWKIVATNDNNLTATQGRTGASRGGTGRQCIIAGRNGEWSISIGSDRGSLAHRHGQCGQGPGRCRCGGSDCGDARPNIAQFENGIDRNQKGLANLT